MLTERDEGNAGKPNQTSPVHYTIGIAVNRASSPSGDICTTNLGLSALRLSEDAYTNLGLSALRPSLRGCLHQPGALHP